MARRIDNVSAEERLAAIRTRNAEYAKKWRAKNPEKAAQIARRYWEKRISVLQQQKTES